MSNVEPNFSKKEKKHLVDISNLTLSEKIKIYNESVRKAVEIRDKYIKEKINKDNN